MSRFDDIKKSVADTANNIAGGYDILSNAIAA